MCNLLPIALIQEWLVYLGIASISLIMLKTKLFSIPTTKSFPIQLIVFYCPWSTKFKISTFFFFFAASLPSFLQLVFQLALLHILPASAIAVAILIQGAWATINNLHWLPSPINAHLKRYQTSLLSNLPKSLHATHTFTNTLFPTAQPQPHLESSLRPIKWYTSYLITSHCFMTSVVHLPFSERAFPSCFLSLPLVVPFASKGSFEKKEARPWDWETVSRHAQPSSRLRSP